ncbi:MAG: hypothetical protein LC802_06540 [Acidobacteria bacterium]|nr:hypothetical protein [Acidobacteriota bacterium]
MSVALRQRVMRLSELTIIYFATAAPFGVASFLRQPTRGASRARSLVRAAGAALLWPLTASLLLLERGTSPGAGRGKAVAREDLHEGRVEQAKRELTNALRAAEDVLDEAGDVGEADAGRDARGEARRYAMFAARESVERYVGLTLACMGAHREASPSGREMELCRLAGGTGDDLLLAGRCIHRRNATRLFAHRERARAEMIHALAYVRELADTFPFAEEIRASASRRISEMLLRAFARAVELLSLLEDEGAARRVARLLDAECARLRRLEAEGADGVPIGGRKGEAICTTPVAHRAFATPLLRTTTSGRG